MTYDPLGFEKLDREWDDKLRRVAEVERAERNPYKDYPQFVAKRMINEIPGIAKKYGLKITDLPIEDINALLVSLYRGFITMQGFKKGVKALCERERTCV